MQLYWVGFGQATVVHSEHLFDSSVGVMCLNCSQPPPHTIEHWLVKCPISSPSGHFMTWCFSGRALYISAGGHHAGRAYSVLRTTLGLACRSPASPSAPVPDLDFEGLRLDRVMGPSPGCLSSHHTLPHWRWGLTGIRVYHKQSENDWLTRFQRNC